MVKKTITYKYAANLVERIIVKRIYNYIMLVKYNNEILRCHCPTNCFIGNFSRKDLPCFLSISNRFKTKYIVEAIKLDNEEKKNKK